MVLIAHVFPLRKGITFFFPFFFLFLCEFVVVVFGASKRIVMARRDRVTRLKSHRKTRNKNPKLSPFQREQRRNKLANQAPIVKPNERDAPKSQRLVLEYLEEKQRKKEAKKAEALQAREEKRKREEMMETSDHSSSTDSPPRKRSKEDASSKNTSDTSNQKKSSSKESLNALLGSSLGPALVAYPTGVQKESPSTSSAEVGGSASSADIIARKKAKKHEKRVEARRERVREQLEKMEKELEQLTKKKGGRKSKEAKDPNAAFEKQLKLMQQEKALEDKKRMLLEKERLKKEAAEEARKVEEREAAALQEAEKQQRRKSISFDESVVAEDEEQKKRKNLVVRKPRDFSDLVDVVRFNERVEAPPVFTAVPNKNASVTRLAHRLEEESRKDGSSKNLRHRLLSSVGGLGEQKRLSRLGLLPAATQQSASAVAAQAAKLSKEKEMETLRAHVMAAYQKKKRRNLEAKKGVDMTHQFPNL